MTLTNEEEYEIAVVGEGSLSELLVNKFLNAGVSVNILHKQAESDKDKQSLRCHASLVSLTRACNIIVTILPDGPMLEKVLFSHDGIARVGSRGTVVIDMSSVSPELIQEISEQFVEQEMFFLDSVVLNEENSDSGLIHMMLFGGDQYAYEKVLPTFELIGPLHGAH